MSWDTDWSNAVSEVISEIQSIAGPITSATSGTLPSVNSADIDGKFCKLLAFGVSGSSTGSLTLNVNGGAVYSNLSVQSSQEFLFVADFVWDAASGNLLLQVLSPAENTNIRYVRASLGSLPTLTFSLDTGAGTGGSVSSFVLKQI